MHQTTRLWAWAIVLAVLPGIVPAQDDDLADDLPPRMRRLDGDELTAVRRETDRLFGTLEAPAFWELSMQGNDRSPGRAGVWRLIEGRELYLANCVKCHGPAGHGRPLDGREPARKVWPADIGRGAFKWTSTNGPPLLHDLSETIRLGVPGTEMPAHPELDEAARLGLAAYVRWLAWRGRSEYDIAIAVNRSGESPSDLGSEALAQVLDRWRSTEVLRPGPMPKSVDSARGRALFASQKCVVCHGDEGRGDVRDAQRAEPGGRFGSLYRGLGQPRDFSTGLLHGGSAPEDLHRRIAFGIPEAGMPRFGTVLNDRDVWDLVAYVQGIAEKPHPDNVQRRPPPSDEALATAATEPSTGEPIPPPLRRAPGRGKLAGRIVLEGRLPTLTPRYRKGDRQRDGVFAEDVYIDGPPSVDARTRGIANVFVYLDSRTAGDVPPPREDQPLRVELSFEAFSPQALVVRKGQPIEFDNVSGAAMNVHTFPPRGLPVNVLVPPGKTYSFTYARPERVPVRVRDDLHPWRRAAQLPLDHDFAAVTNATGDFEIDGLPAGEHQIVVWHERADKLATLRIEIRDGKTTDLQLAYPLSEFDR